MPVSDWTFVVVRNYGCIPSIPPMPWQKASIINALTIDYRERMMRRYLLILLILTQILASRAAIAQGTLQAEQNYRSEPLGIAFQYPADWVVREQLLTQTVTASSQTDMAAVA